MIVFGCTVTWSIYTSYKKWRKLSTAENEAASSVAKNDTPLIEPPEEADTETANKTSDEKSDDDAFTKAEEDGAH